MDKPKIRFKGFEDDWEQCKVSDLGNIVTGSTPPTNDKSNYDGEYLFVSPADIHGNRYVENTITTLTEKGFNKGRILKSGSTLFVSIGSTIGKVAQTLEKSTTNQQINAIEANEEYDDNFVFSLMENASGKIKSVAATQAVPIVNKTTFGETKIMVSTNLTEQQKIGEYFSHLDNLITLHQRKCDETKKLKKYMLQKMFPQNGAKTPEIRFNGFTDDWEQRKLGDVADVRDGTHASPKYYETGHPFVTSKNVKDGFINYDDIQYISDEDFNEINKRSKVDVNDILMGMIGTIGNIALIREEPDFALKNVALIKDTKQINYLYLYHFLQSNRATMQLDNCLDGGTQKFVALGNIRNLCVDIPNEEEQQKIGEYFSHLDNLITLHQRKCDELKKLKKYMLQNMFI